MAFTNSIVQNMAKNKQIEEIRLSDFPEEMDKQHGVNLWGDLIREHAGRVKPIFASWSNQP